MPFDQIEAAVHRGDVDLGLLIHEGQLTYADDGLQLWVDLGEWWLAETGLPLPLGGNVVRRDLGPEVIEQIARDLRASIVYCARASRRRAGSRPAVQSRHLRRAHRHLRRDVRERVDVDYGERGRQAVQLLLDRAAEAEIIPRKLTSTSSASSSGDHLRGGAADNVGVIDCLDFGGHRRGHGRHIVSTESACEHPDDDPGRR